jgi:hypothetical protein
VWGNHNDARLYGAERAVDLFKRDIERGSAGWPGIGRTLTPQMIRAELGGRDLACWCALDQPCHADVLLEIANGHSASSAAPVARRT